MDIRDQKLMQLVRKISSSQVKSRSHKVLKQRVGDITYGTVSSFFVLHIWFLSNTQSCAGLFRKNIKELFYTLSATLILSEPSSS